MPDNESHRRYYTQIPNIVDDSILSVSAIRLYLHIKRIAGDNGVCTESQATLAKRCRMTGRTIVRAKYELHDGLFIKIEHVIKGGHPAHVIHIRDIWEENEETYKPIKQWDGAK
jgi:hypothetical protein